MTKSNVVTSTNYDSNYARAGRLVAGLLAATLCCLNSVEARAQRTTPSHGKTRFDSYNHLLRDVHPASQAQANYEQNRLFATGVKKAERLERQDRVDIYNERQIIKRLERLDSVSKTLSAGRPTSTMNVISFWAVVSLYGDRAEVYDALSEYVPTIAHEQFVPTSEFMEIVRPSGELELPPLLLEAAGGVDASKYQAAWATLTKHVRASSRLSAKDVARFHNSVMVYRECGAAAIENSSSAVGRYQAKTYLHSLGSLADALYRPEQCARIERYVRDGGYAYQGGSMLGLVQHMLRNRVTPAQGSTAQVALAEIARPVSRVLEQEIALHYERIDSLAAGEGHRPYAAEYQLHEEPPLDAKPGTQVTQAKPANGVGT